MDWCRLGLILTRWAMTSFLKAAFQATRLGFFALKIKSFLSFQRHQAPIMNTSMKKGWTNNWLAKSSFWWTLTFSSQVIPKANHLHIVEGQSKNKCSRVSSVLSWHKAQLYPSSRNLFLLLNMFLVFNISFSNSQAKNLIFGIHFVLQIQMIVLWGCNDLNWYW